MTAQRAYAAAFAILTWFALAAQVYLLLRNAPATPAGVAHAVGTFLSYFTLVTNLLAAAAMTLWARGGGTSGLLSRYQGAAALAVYLCVVGLVYLIHLRQLWQPTGLQQIADVLMHYVTPPACAVYWVVFVPKGRLRWSHAFTWLLYPVAYAAYIGVQGTRTGRYPYPFMDAAALGYFRVLPNLALLLALFLGISVLLIAFDKVAARRCQTAPG